MSDWVEDSIYATPIGATTPWRCAKCKTAIAHAGQPCRCFFLFSGRACTKLPNLHTPETCAEPEKCPNPTPVATKTSSGG